jgi:hypothetical protein
MSLKPKLIGLLKVTAAGACVAAIFFALTTTSPDGTVKNADADILDLIPGDVFAGRNTTEVIAKSGLIPRAYEINGNKVLFAVGQTQMSPRNVLDYYQEQFVTSGVNSRKWLDTPKGGQMNEAQKKVEGEKGLTQLRAMTAGEVVPYFATDDYVSMGGPVPRGKPFPELIKEWAENPPDSPTRVFKGFRFIDAQKQGNGSRITSVWADEDFDFKAMKNPNESKLGPNLKVPACPGCKLIVRTKSLEPDEELALEQYLTPQDSNTTYEFYRRAMLSRGWELTDTSATMEYVASRVPDMPFNTKGKFLAFAKNDEFVTIAVLREPQSGTVVSVSETK